MNKLATESVLTCSSWQQAQSVIDRLFDKQLISRAEVIPMKEGLDEVRLIMESIEQDLLKVTDEIAGLFGHRNFNLQLL